MTTTHKLIPQTDPTDGTRFIKDTDHVILFGQRYHERADQGKVGDLSCIACGRDTSKQGNSMGVLVSGGGALIVHPEDYDRFDHHNGDMGWFPVGAECIKKVPVEFREPNPYDDAVQGV